MLTPSDGSADGNKLGYLKQPERYRAYDPDLFDLLRSTVAMPDGRRLVTIEGANAIPNAIYFNAKTPQERPARAAYMDACRTAFADCELVFFDPDNGLEVPSVSKGSKLSPKFVFLDEIAAVYASGKSILIYQHYPRIERGVFAATCAARLSSVASDAQIWRFSTGNVLFLLVLHPRFC